MKRLVCVVEGHGEVEAVPVLCDKIRRYLSLNDWRVDPHPIRLPRNQLVEYRSDGRGGCRLDKVKRVLFLAKQRPADAVILLCDQDDDCPATWGADVTRLADGIVVAAGVMAVREYESWLLWNESLERLQAIGAPVPETIRGAKEKLAVCRTGYLPTVHQQEMTRSLDVPRVRSLSDSFDKLVRAVATLCGVNAPARPSPAES